ncbi:MAG: PQQ-dependent sugar dehydrogenase, partial [Planctomycetaceae bacterium]|nr:PQQ-dependent sugar dehydrogenase [Planctomycetaceae bacterium]
MTELRSCLLLVGVAFVGLAYGTDPVCSADKFSPRPAWTTSKIQGMPTPPAPYQIVSAFPRFQFDHPSSLEEMPNGRMLVAEIGGRIYSFNKKTPNGKLNLVGDLKEVLPQELSRNVGRLLLDVTLHPNFAKNRYLFVAYAYPGKEGHRRVSRFKVTERETLDLKSETVILTWPTGGHSEGCLNFGKDGMLYISTGDGSGPNPPDGLTTGQDISDLLGSILRIDVDHPR